MILLTAAHRIQLQLHNTLHDVPSDFFSSIFFSILLFYTDPSLGKPVRDITHHIPLPQVTELDELDTLPSPSLSSISLPPNASSFSNSHPTTSYTGGNPGWMGSTDWAKAHDSWRSAVCLCDSRKQVVGHDAAGVILLARNALHIVFTLSWLQLIGKYLSENGNDPSISILQTQTPRFKSC